MVSLLNSNILKRRVNLGIDLGSDNTSIFETNKGKIFREPSVIAVNTLSNKVITIGKPAHEMIGKTPKFIECIKPINKGNIHSFDFSELLISEFIHKTLNNKFKINNLTIAIPSNLTNLEKVAINEAFKIIGARNLSLVNKSLAALVGCNVDVANITGLMIVDIGASYTEIGVISLGGCVISKTINISGDSINNDIINYVKSKFNVNISSTQALVLKESVESLCNDIDPNSSKSISVFKDSLPFKLDIPIIDIQKILKFNLIKVIDCIKDIIENISIELKSDILLNGIILSGGHCNIRDIDKYFESNLEIKCKIPENFLTCIAEGAGKISDTFSQAYIDNEHNEIVLLN